MSLKDMVHNKRSKLEDVIPLTQPYTIFLDPCGACNLKCVFCPCNTSQEKKAERHKIMSFDLFLKIVEDLKEFPEKIKVIYLYSYGEPLLHPRICEMITLLKESNVCEEVRLTTNALLLTHDLSERLANSGVDIVRLSLYGKNAEDYKEFCQVDMDYEKFIEELRYFYKMACGKTKFHVKGTTAFLKTEEDLKWFAKTFEEYSDYRTIEAIVNLWSDFNTEITSEKVDLNQLYENIQICSSSFAYMGIHSNGVVSPCCMDWKFDVSYGDVTEHSLLEIWNSDTLRTFQLSLLKKEKGLYPFCDVCNYRIIDNIDEVADTLIQRLEGS